MNQFRRLLALSATLALALTVGLVAGCSDDEEAVEPAATTAAPETSEEATDTTDASGDEEAGADVEIENAWARSTPAAATRGAAFMELTSAVDDRLVAASVDPSIAMTVELHETVEKEDGSGEMEMRQVQAIELPAGEKVVLAPGGFHIMFMDLAAPLEAGSEFELTLEFEKAGAVTIVVSIREMEGGMMGGGMGGGEGEGMQHGQDG